MLLTGSSYRPPPVFRLLRTSAQANDYDDDDVTIDSKPNFRILKPTNELNKTCRLAGSLVLCTDPASRQCEQVFHGPSSKIAPQGPDCVSREAKEISGSV